MLFTPIEFGVIRDFEVEGSSRWSRWSSTVSYFRFSVNTVSCEIVVFFLHLFAWTSQAWANKIGSNFQNRLKNISKTFKQLQEIHWIKLKFVRSIIHSESDSVSSLWKSWNMVKKRYKMFILQGLMHMYSHGSCMRTRISCKSLFKIVCSPRESTRTYRIFTNNSPDNRWER